MKLLTSEQQESYEIAKIFACLGEKTTILNRKQKILFQFQQKKQLKELVKLEKK